MEKEGTELNVRLAVVERDVAHMRNELQVIWRKIDDNTKATHRNTIFVKSAMAVVSCLIVLSEILL